MDMSQQRSWYIIAEIMFIGFFLAYLYFNPLAKDAQENMASQKETFERARERGRIHEMRAPAGVEAEGFNGKFSEPREARANVKNFPGFC